MILPRVQIAPAAENEIGKKVLCAKARPHAGIPLCPVHSVIQAGRAIVQVYKAAFGKVHLNPLFGKKGNHIRFDPFSMADSHPLPLTVAIIQKARFLIQYTVELIPGMGCRQCITAFFPVPRADLMLPIFSKFFCTPNSSLQIQRISVARRQSAITGIAPHFQIADGC